MMPPRIQYPNLSAVASFLLVGNQWPADEDAVLTSFLNYLHRCMNCLSGEQYTARIATVLGLGTRRGSGGEDRANPLHPLVLDCTMRELHEVVLVHTRAALTELLALGLVQTAAGWQVGNRSVYERTNEGVYETTELQFFDIAAKRLARAGWAPDYAGSTPKRGPRPGKSVRGTRGAR